MALPLTSLEQAGSDDGVEAANRPAREPLIDAARGIVTNVERVMRGRRDVVELLVAAVVAGGHVLLEDTPGAGKTTLAKALARTLGGSFRRIQGTADLLPTDVTGAAVWRPDLHAFDFVPGPLFGNVVLVDELNRTPPRTQSAFLEAMDEGGVTIDGRRHDLPDPFVAVATQNPVEHFGTYPLPDGQLDRFAMTLRLGPNDPATERYVVREQLAGPTVDSLGPSISVEGLRHVRAEVRRTHVADAIVDYAVRLAESTRRHAEVASGGSTRAAISLVRCAQARALLHGRPHVLPDDVKMLAVPVLAHRLILATPQSDRARAIVIELLSAVPAPAP
jgi:MoxR-like ATPase